MEPILNGNARIGQAAEHQKRLKLTLGVFTLAANSGCSKSNSKERLRNLWSPLSPRTRDSAAFRSLPKNTSRFPETAQRSTHIVL